GWGGSVGASWVGGAGMGGGAGRVWVLLGSRDGEPYLGAALASLAAQTCPGVEVVAVDDGSRDGTAAQLEQLARERPRVRVLRTPGIGLAGALARAAPVAGGEVLARPGGDARPPPERPEPPGAHLRCPPG